MWDELDRSVRKVHPTNQQSLIDELKKAWNAISGTFLKKIVEQMSHIWQAVVKSRGGYCEESKVLVGKTQAPDNYSKNVF